MEVSGANRDTLIGEAVRTAWRSPHRRFKTGAILVSASGTILERGWAHPQRGRLSSYRSVHAELHLLQRARAARLDCRGCVCIVATVRPRTMTTTSGQPCARCAGHLNDAGIQRVIYTTSCRPAALDLRGTALLRQYRAPQDGALALRSWTVEYCGERTPERAWPVR
jgi:tRNA(Arg) A34 adenosine deaminase TadA